MITFVCAACGAEEQLEELVESAAEDAYYADMYLSMTDGGDPPLGNCNSCASLTFHVATGQCLRCLGELEYATCAVCGAGLSSDEQDFHGLCGYHHWQVNKDE